MSEPADLRIWSRYLTGIDLKAGSRFKVARVSSTLYAFYLESALLNHHHEQLLS